MYVWAGSLKKKKKKNLHINCMHRLVHTSLARKKPATKPLTSRWKKVEKHGSHTSDHLINISETLGFFPPFFLPMEFGRHPTYVVRLSHLIMAGSMGREKSDCENHQHHQVAIIRKIDVEHSQSNRWQQEPSSHRRLCSA